MHMKAPELPGEQDYEALQELAIAAAAQLAPCIMCSSLQGHYLNLRLLLCLPDSVPTVRTHAWHAM